MTEVDRMAVIERLWLWHRHSDNEWGLCADEAHAESLRKYRDEFEVVEYTPAEQHRAVSPERVHAYVQHYGRLGYDADHLGRYLRGEFDAPPTAGGQ